MCSVAVRAGVEVRASLRPDYCGIMESMSEQDKTVIPKKRGPKPTGKGVQVMVRLQPDLLSLLDAHIATIEPKPTRPEAIRAILEATLLPASFSEKE